MDAELGPCARGRLSPVSPERRCCCLCRCRALSDRPEGEDRPVAGTVRETADHPALCPTNSSCTRPVWRPGAPSRGTRCCRGWREKSRALRKPEQGPADHIVDDTGWGTSSTPAHCGQMPSQPTGPHYVAV